MDETAERNRADSSGNATFQVGRGVYPPRVDLRPTRGEEIGYLEASEKGPGNPSKYRALVYIVTPRNFRCEDQAPLAIWTHAWLRWN